jgi:hypothetical protein
MHGKVVWMEHQRATLDVHVGGQVPGATKTLHYRRSGSLLCYVGESQTPAPGPDADPPPTGVLISAEPTRRQHESVPPEA